MSSTWTPGPPSVPARPPLADPGGDITREAAATFRPAPPSLPQQSSPGSSSATTPPPAPRRSAGWRVPAAIVVSAALLAGGYVAGRAVDSDPAATNVTTVDTGTAQPTETLTTPDGAEPVAAVAAAISPAVVQLEVGQGLGSGVIYDSEGLILTAAHVVEGADELTVRLSDGREIPGEVVGLHTETDVGVVRIDPPDGMAVAPLATEPPSVGDIAVAVGSPFALEQTVTAGIVSAVDRAVPGGVSVGVTQTDAPINPGNSGGPLVNAQGEVIGLNSFIQSGGGGSDGLGFAIPIDTAKRVADLLVAGEPVQLGFLGVSTGDPTDGNAGALVAEVTAGSAADNAGLQQGDVITAVNGEAVLGSADLGASVKDHDAGDQINLTIVRNGETLELNATLDSAG